MFFFDSLISLFCRLTNNGIFESFITADTAVQQIDGILVTEVRGNGINARSSSAFRTARISVEHRIPVGLPLLARRLNDRDSIVVVIVVRHTRVFSAEYVVQNHTSYVRWTVISGLLALLQWK